MLPKGLLNEAQELKTVCQRLESLAEEHPHVVPPQLEMEKAFLR
jgi:hypothetical protein